MSNIRSLINDFLVIAFVTTFIFSCVKEEPVQPLPPPVKPMVQENVKQEDVKTPSKVDVKPGEYIAQKGAEQTGTDCKQICQKIEECSSSSTYSFLMKEPDACRKICEKFSEDLKKAISSSQDCGFVRCNLNKYFCETGCKEISDCGTSKKDASSCIKGCMDMLYKSDIAINTLVCFANSSNSCDQKAKCVKRYSTIQKIEDYCK